MPHSAVLAWCNGVREALEMAPIPALPKGKRGSPCHCPVGRALSGATWGSGEVVCFCSQIGYDVHPMRTPNRSIASGSMPQHVKDFMTRFDNGTIPELVE